MDYRLRALMEGQSAIEKMGVFLSCPEIHPSQLHLSSVVHDGFNLL